MILFAVALAFSQNGLQFMLQAASYESDPFSNPTQAVLILRINATNIARHINNNEELLNIAINSGDTTHRVAAAFSLGLKPKVSPSLFRLAEDYNSMVVQASREAFIYIAAVKLNKTNVDFGPYPNSSCENKYHSSAMWKSFFKQHNLIQDQYSPQQKSTTNPVPNKNVQVKKYHVDEDDIFSPNYKLRKPEQKPVKKHDEDDIFSPNYKLRKPEQQPEQRPVQRPVQRPKPEPDPDQEFDFDPNVPLPPDRFDPDWLVVKARAKNVNR